MEQLQRTTQVRPVIMDVQEWQGVKRALNLFFGSTDDPGKSLAECSLVEFSEADEAACEKLLVKLA